VSAMQSDQDTRTFYGGCLCTYVRYRIVLGARLTAKNWFPPLTTPPPPPPPSPPLLLPDSD